MCDSLHTTPDMIRQIAIRCNYDTMMSMSTVYPHLHTEMETKQFWIDMLSDCPMSRWSRSKLPERSIEALQLLLVEHQTATSMYSVQSAYFIGVEELVYRELMAGRTLIPIRFIDNSEYNMGRYRALAAQGDPECLKAVRTFNLGPLLLEAVKFEHLHLVRALSTECIDMIDVCKCLEEACRSGDVEIFSVMLQMYAMKMLVCNEEGHHVNYIDDIALESGNEEIFKMMAKNISAIQNIPLLIERGWDRYITSDDVLDAVRFQQGDRSKGFHYYKYDIDSIEMLDFMMKNSTCGNLIWKDLLLALDGTQARRNIMDHFMDKYMANMRFEHCWWNPPFKVHPEGRQHCIDIISMMSTEMKVIIFPTFHLVTIDNVEELTRGMTQGDLTTMLIRCLDNEWLCEDPRVLDVMVWLVAHGADAGDIYRYAYHRDIIEVLLDRLITSEFICSSDREDLSTYIYAIQSVGGGWKESIHQRDTRCIARMTCKSRTI